MDNKKAKVKRKYSEEFKREVVAYATSSAKPIKQICHEFGIGKSMYYAWRKACLVASVRGGGGSEGGVAERADASSPLEMADEIRKLHKEIANLKRQREILKKAMSILGENP